MNTCKSSALVRLYKGPKHPINDNYAELRLIKAACMGDIATACSLFCGKKLFGGEQCIIDTPCHRYEGISGVRDFVTEFLLAFHATTAEVVPVIQTRANGRSVSEVQVCFSVHNGFLEVPFFIVGDLRTQDKLDEVRIYTHCSFVPGLQAYRKPLFSSAHLEMGDPGLLTGAVREYYEALHHMPKADVDRIMACTSENCQFGGYEPDDIAHQPTLTREALRTKYEHMAEYIPRCVGMRYETITDDGRNCIIEWVHIVSRAGQVERNRIAMSGIAAYERGDDGLLCSIRISDYAGLERSINWSRLPININEASTVNFVENFPEGVGAKPQKRG